MATIDLYSICGKQVIGDSIFCNSWVHPDCNFLSKSDFELHVNSDESETWFCLKCSCGTLTDPCMIEDPVSPFLNLSNDHGNLWSYFDTSSFNYKSFENDCFSLLHSNICSLNKDFDNFQTFLSSLNHKFKVIGN